MHILFCRHAQTVFNKEDRYQGICDSSLTQEGIEQSKDIAAYINDNFSIDLCLLSPLPRVKATFDHMGLDVSHEIFPILREICYGDWEGKKRDEIDPLQLAQKEKDRFHFVHPGTYEGIDGESYAMQYERLVPFFKEVVIFEKDTILIIAHQGVLVSAVKYFQSLNDEETGKVRIANDAVFVVEISQGRYIGTIQQIH